MSYTVPLGVVLCLFAYFPSVLSDDKVNLTDVQLLTFRQGLYTTSRRSHSVPQLICRGGSAGCQHQPAVVECYNRGTDGRDVQWECKADMNKSQEIGMTRVTCEGYDNPQDEYVLQGSCSLQYTLEKTGCDGCSKDGASGQKGPNGDHPTTSALPSLQDVLNSVYLILAVIGACVLCTCCCALFCPSKGRNYEFSGVVLQDKHGNQKVVNIPPRTQGRIEEVEVIHLKHVSRSSRRNEAEDCDNATRRATL